VEAIPVTDCGVIGTFADRPFGNPARAEFPQSREQQPSTGG
jgi:hypothetical protein